MSLTPRRPGKTALELRRAFDAGFAEAPQAASPTLEDLLAIALAGDSYAVRLRDVAGLFKDRRVTRLPSPLAEFVGAAGVQGRIVPVYDLRVLMGYPPTANPRWLLLVSAPEPLGLAFDAFEGLFRVPSELLTAAAGEGRRHVSEAVGTRDVLRQVVDVASVVATVRARTRQSGPPKER